MCESMENQQQISDAVTQFARTYLSARPQSVLVDVHDSHVLITLRQVVCPVERDYAREPDSRERLERLFSNTFDAVKGELEKVIAAIVGRGVQQSRLSVDPPTGDAILMLSMEGSTEPRRSDRQEEGMANMTEQTVRPEVQVSCPGESMVNGLHSEHLGNEKTPVSCTGARKPMWQVLNPPEELREILAGCPSVHVASTIGELVDLACGGKGRQSFETAYDLPDGRRIVEAVTVRVRNGVATNYTEPYMRRRDPDCTVIGDARPTDKETFRQRFGKDFERLRHETFAWLKTQDLAIYGFVAGRANMGLDAIVVAPANAGFFALGLALLQGIIPVQETPASFAPQAIVYVAPVFRHTHFAGRQVVVHNRKGDLHEVFSFNLYPGPSAKKGIYGVLLELGERQGWVAPHCSTVQVITPYDNLMTIMHEGASGGGKSEMLEQPHREPDGRLLVGENTVSGERLYLEVPRSCELRPVNDDMALCHPALQKGSGKLVLCDAEDAWFVRVNHIGHYGTDPHLEKLTAEPPMPLLFLNIDAVPGSRALIWEHIEDAPGRPCPNPRVIIPRKAFSNAVEEPVTVDVRSFGVRTPPCTKERPNYGIVGMFHVLPPALAWLWRLVAPRGHANPSIVDTEGMTTEGVGSYWPFATGKRVNQANLLLRQFVEHRRMRYILCPNQYIGVWRVGFMPQWIARDYLARRGVAKFRPDQLRPARCSLLGYTLRQLQLEGRLVDRCLLQVEMQPEVGEAAYDRGAQIFDAFFRKHLADFQCQDLDPLGKEIIRCCLDCGKAEDYEKLISAG